jgi:glycine/D-amino acid oxidase-like deaminating enzyme
VIGGGVAPGAAAAQAFRREAFTAVVIRASGPLPPEATSSSARQQVGTDATRPNSCP